MKSDRGHSYWRPAYRRGGDDHFDRGESRLEEAGLLLTLASAARLLVGNLRSVPAEVQPDLSTDISRSSLG
jgi:hypothetical protein